MGLIGGPYLLARRLSEISDNFLQGCLRFQIAKSCYSAFLLITKFWKFLEHILVRKFVQGSFDSQKYSVSIAVAILWQKMDSLWVFTSSLLAVTVVMANQMKMNLCLRQPVQRPLPNPRLPVLHVAEEGVEVSYLHLVFGSCFLLLGLKQFFSWLHAHIFLCLFGALFPASVKSVCHLIQYIIFLWCLINFLRSLCPYNCLCMR